MSAAPFRLLAFMALAAGSAALWIAFVGSTGESTSLAPALPSVSSQSIFIPSAPPDARQPKPQPPLPTVRAQQRPTASRPESAGRTVGEAVTSHACGSCAVRILAGGVVRVQVPAGSGERQAYALLDLGGRAADGHIVARDVIGFGHGQNPVRAVTVLQVLDSARRVIFELVARPDRRLYLDSPAGGLQAAPLERPLGAKVPNDGVSGIAVAVAARANDSLAAYVNGVRTLSARALSGATTAAPRFVATGVIGYTGAPSAPPITATHAQVSVSVSPTPAAPAVAVVPLPRRRAVPTSPASTPPALTATVPPTVVGRAVVGSTLTGLPGSWSDPAATFTYAWQRCDASGSCTPIEGATTRTYTLVRADRDAFVRVRVTARDGATSGSKSSAAVGPVTRAAPTPVTGPRVDGDAVVGSTLTADAGTWSDPAATFGYAWQRCDDTGTCTSIADATHATYTPGADDVGSALRVEVTATNKGGATTADSDPTGLVLPQAPAVVTAPSVSGDASVGSTLAADPGVWSDANATFAYAWQRCDDAGACVAIANATGSTYDVTADDVGQRLAVTVTATGAGGTASATSLPTAPVSAPVPVPPAANGTPTIDGTPYVGSTLTASPGSWSDPSATFAYAWQRCDSGGSCSPIDGATGTTYVPTANDVGQNIRVEVTATGADGTLGTSDSAGIGPIVLPPPPSVGTAPTITGDATVGSTLTADPGTWSDPPPTLSYAWQRCEPDSRCEAIPGATGRTYTPTTDDVGSRLRVEVVAENAVGTGSADSETTAAVALPAPPAPLSPPVVSGDAVVGSLLTASAGQWSGAPSSLAYAWQRCDADGACTDIRGAVDETYQLRGEDEGRRVRVRVTAANAGGAGDAESAATAVVAAPAAPSLVDAPVVSGDAVAGSTLSTDGGSWSDPSATLAYAWQRCDAEGACRTVASGPSYALTAPDVGFRIRVLVSASNGAASPPASSAEVGPVAGAQTTTAGTTGP